MKILTNMAHLHIFQDIAILKPPCKFGGFIG